MLEGAVRFALSRIDDDASIGGISAGPGVVLIEDLSMPGRGFDAPAVFVYWSLVRLPPGVDSVHIPSCSIELDGSGGGGGGGRRRGRDIPLLILDEARISRGGGDTTVFQGRGSLSDGRADVLGSASGPWGGARLAVRGGTPGSSIEADFYDCTSLPLFDHELPGELGGTAFSGSLHGMLLPDSIFVEGTALEADGMEIDIPFSLSFSERSSILVVDTGLGGTEALVERLIRSFDPAAWVDLDSRGGVRLVFDGGDSCRFELDARLEDAGIHSTSLAIDTVRFSCALEADGTIRDGRLSVDSGLLTLGELAVAFTMEASTGEGALVLDAWNDSIPGGALTSSIPAALLGPLDGLVLSGWMSMAVHLRIDRQFPDSSDISIEIGAEDLAVVSCPLNVGRYAAGGSCVRTDSWGNSRLIGLSSSLNRSFVALSDLPPWFEPLLCCAEDGAFRSHDGFSPDHIRSSLVEDVRTGRFARGASTLTMQLARNLFLSRGKTLSRKLQEVFLTWRLEELLTKNRILEIYANIVELGPDVFGFGEASLYYFGVPVGELGVRETAFLVSMLPGPRIYHAFYERGRVPDWWEEYLDVLVEAAARRGGMTQEEATLALGHRIRFN